MVFTVLAKIIIFPFKFLKWVLSWLACSIIVALLLSTPAEGLSSAQKGAISQNCPTIKQSLEQLQKVDSKTRTYLGTTYETIANKFIIPLNLRLVKNNRPTLSNIQSDFITEQSKFRNSYTEYMREMESLINSDCKTNPEAFYRQLVVVRGKRVKLHDNVDKLNHLATEQFEATRKLRNTL